MIAFIALADCITCLHNTGSMSGTINSVANGSIRIAVGFFDKMVPLLADAKGILTINNAFTMSRASDTMAWIFNAILNALQTFAVIAGLAQANSLAFRSHACSVTVAGHSFTWICV